MPGQVTGTIGQEEVRLENAATESTLMMLVDAMNKMAAAQGGTSGAGSAGNKVQKLYNESIKKGNDLTKDTNKQLKDKNKNLKDVNKNLEDFGAKLGRGVQGVKNLTDSLGQLMKSIYSDATPTIEGFASKVPVVGGLFGALGGILDQNIKTFRNLAGAGVDLGSGIFAAQTAAAKAGLPLETFSRVVAENSVALARFGDTAGGGAQRFANIVGKLDKKELARLGMSMDEIAENTASYLEIQSRTGRLAQMSQQQLTSGAQEYNTELDKLARATGINRKALDDANKAAARDTRMRTALSKLEPAERARVLARIKQMEEAGATEAAEGLKDLIASGGVAVTENARNLVLSNREFADSAAAISKGQKGAAGKLDKTLSDTAKSAQNMSDGAAQTATTLATMGRTTPMYIGKSLESFTDAGKDVEKASEQQAKAKADESKNIAATDQQLTELQNKLKVALIPVLIKFSDILMKYLIPAAIKLVDGLVSVIKFFEGKSFTEGLLIALSAGIGLLFAKAAVAGIINKALSKSLGAIGLASPGGRHPPAMSAPEMASPKGKKAAGTKMSAPEMASPEGKKAAGTKSTSPGKKQSPGKSLAPPAGKSKAGPAPGSSMASMGEGLGKGMGAALAGLAKGLGALANPAALVGIGAVTLAVMGLAKAFEIASPGFENFGKLLKSGFEGIGSVVKSVGVGISSVIGSISDGIGNIIGKITEFQNAGVNATTDQITKLSKIPSENMHKAASGITAMKTALDGFSPGLMGGISQGLGSMFGGDQADKINKLADAGSRLAPVGGYLTAINSGMDGLSQGFVKFEKVDFSKLEVGAKNMKDLSVSVNDTYNNFKKLETSNFDGVTEKLAKVTDSIKQMGKDIAQGVASVFGGGKDKKSPEQLLSDIDTELKQLNMTMTTLIGIQQGASGNLAKTAKYSKKGTGVMY
jgi:hypothetical protein